MEEKHVTFDLKKNQIKILYVYEFAMRQSRQSDYYFSYLDHIRFKKRINLIENVLNKCLTKNHRLSVYKERFEKL